MSKNFFLALKVFPRHYNKYNFTETHTTSATKEELHNHYDEAYLYQTRRSDYGEKEREKYSLNKTNVLF
jgi:hypothetical protein